MPFSSLDETLSLSILKLDSSSFCIEVAKAASVGNLKRAVEAVFSHMPQKGPGKISWPHVWGQFCLCYQGHKLLPETDYLADFGIKDGDQLHFVRHLCNPCSFRRKRLKKQVVNSRSLSQVNRYQQKELSNDEEIDLDGIVIENGKIQNCTAEENCVGKSRLTRFLGGLLSYNQLAVVRRTRIEARICVSVIARGLVSSFRKVARILHY